MAGFPATAKPFSVSFCLLGCISVPLSHEFATRKPYSTEKPRICHRSRMRRARTGRPARSRPRGVTRGGHTTAASGRPLARSGGGERRSGGGGGSSRAPQAGDESRRRAAVAGRRPSRWWGRAAGGASGGCERAAGASERWGTDAPGGAGPQRTGSSQARGPTCPAPSARNAAWARTPA